MSLQDFSDWLQSTSASARIQETFWVIPTLQTVHILGLAVVLSSVAMLSLRLFGMAGRSRPLPEAVHRFIPWIWGALLVLLISGAALIVGEPERVLLNDFFWIKMAALVGAVLMTAVFQYVSAHGAESLDRRRFAAGVTATVWLVLWIGAAAAGRWIAYFGRA